MLATLATLFAGLCAESQIIERQSVIFMLSDKCSKGSPCQKTVEEKLSTICEDVRLKPILRMVTASCPGSDANAAGEQILAAVPNIESFEDDFEIQLKA